MTTSNTGRLRWLPILTIAMLPAHAQTVQTSTYSYAGNPLPILRDSADLATLAFVDVPRGMKIQDVKLTVNIEYPQAGDINLFLYSPAGTRTRLLERNCGSAGILLDTTFDDKAPSAYRDFCPAEAGRTLRGNEPLGNSRGENAIGRWTLAVETNGSDDRTGWLLGYSLTLTGEVLTTPTFTTYSVTNAAGMHQRGIVAPGEVISIYGLALGPETPVEAVGATLPSALGGTSVTIGDKPAPIQYASKYRLTVQVPYSMAPGGQAWIVVQSRGGTSAAVPVDVASATPGLYTRSVSGLGAVEALNDNGQANSPENPAGLGSKVTVFASGLGGTTPAIEAGIAPPSSPIAEVQWPVYASINGYPALVQSASLVPDRPGLYQVTLVIPERISVGAVPIKISSGSYSSQDGAVIWVK
jgi:uncharacterized protein (TIGR03437 family)